MEVGNMQHVPISYVIVITGVLFGLIGVIYRNLTKEHE